MSEFDSGTSPRLLHIGKGQASNLITLLHNRELGRRNSNIIRIKAQLPFSDLQIVVQKGTAMSTLNKKNLCGRYSGYLGITHNSRFLVSMISRPEKINSIFFFTFTPKEAKLNRILVTEIPNGYLYLIKVFVPPRGTNFTAVYIHDIAEYNSLTNKENNLPIHLHISPSKYLFQINLSNLIVVVPRIVANTVNKKSIKHYVATHEDGVILNTGVAMVNYMFVDVNKIRENNLVRKVWKITRKPYVSLAKARRCTHSLDLGESISISGIGNCSSEDFKFQYRLVNFEEEIPEDEELLSVAFVRDYFAIDDWLSDAIKQYLRKSAEFQGSALRALQDYEADVSELENSIITIQAFALCELETYKESHCVNEFHLFHLFLKWDLSRPRLTFVSEPRHLGKIEPRFVFANRWWPVRSSGAVVTKEIHQYLCNSHILKGDRICKQLSAYNESLELTYDPDHFYSILRPEEIDF